MTFLMEIYVQSELSICAHFLVLSSANQNKEILVQRGVLIRTSTKEGRSPTVRVTDVCESSKNVPDDIEKVVTYGTGPKEVMGGSEHSQNEFAHENNDMNANDQYKQGPETDIVTDNPKRP
jgi:hypothetical protein